MNRLFVLTALFFLAAGLAPAQKKKEQVPVSGAVLRSETKVVAVDVVATDKKGNYVANLEAKDFRVWEDNKEQVITSFSAGANSAPTRYLILFFDGMNLSAGDQTRARQVATQFAQAVAGESRRMAVIDFDNSIRVAQDFTSNVDRLTAAIKSVRMSVRSPMANAAANLGPNYGGRGSQIGPPPGTSSSFASRVLVLSLRELAKNLNSVPGRKTMIWFSGGFQADNNELQGMLDVFNRSNVAIFPVDMGTLTGVTPYASSRPPSPLRSAFSSLFSAPTTPAVFGFQQSGTTGGGAPAGGAAGGGATTPPAGGGATGAAAPGGGAAGGAAPAGSSAGAGGARSGGASSPSSSGMGDASEMRGGRQDMRNPSFNNMPIDPGSSHRQTLATLADRTGGFVIRQSTDTLEGLAKIGREQESFYLLGYTPPPSEEGTCHSLKVKVNRGGVNLRSRSSYCNARPSDLLAGNPIEKDLETKAGGSQTGNLPAAIQLPYFYTAENVARVNAAMELTLANLKFEKLKGKPHAAIHVLGTAYTADGGVGARFSDTVNLDFEDQAAADRFKERPYHYENQFEIAPGQYNVKLVFSASRDHFGKLETPLFIDPYHPSQFAISALALSTQIKRATNLDLSGGVSLLGDNIPLVAGGMQVIPAGASQFVKKQTAGFYCEVYEPLLVKPDPNIKLAVAIEVRVFDRKSGLQKFDSGPVRVDVPEKSDTPAIHLGLKAPIDDLEPGSYFLELTASDTAGKVAKRSAPFEIQ